MDDDKDAKIEELQERVEELEKQVDEFQSAADDNYEQMQTITEELNEIIGSISLAESDAIELRDKIK